ncbi:MAG: argininosuccinate lyase [Desulfovibrionales bacterium]|nr:argininosuccinate lyase [Desulfovibrionales bacterium]
MWGGRFTGGTAPLVERYTCSVDVDSRIYAQDIAGSKAHAAMLARQGIISAEDLAAIDRGLTLIQAEIEAGTFLWREDLEDVHMNIENRLTEIVGAPGQKLHTGRSRNDQVALDFRLFVASCLDQWASSLCGLIQVLLGRAEAHQDTLLPGCTHFQPAQPVSLAQHILAYAQMFRRDHARVRDACKRVRVSPLGAAALAGTTHPLDPEQVKATLGLDDVFANSMDAVSDRDFVLEAVFCASIIMMHLSRLCEEIIIWANPRFGFVRLPDAYSTGSSIMPQKKNPDVAELMRGKTGRVYGDLTSLLTLMKGLPLTYNRDLQEDKEPFLDAHDTVLPSLDIMAGMMEELHFNQDRMREALKSGFLNATELADYLAAKGIPFRQAHHITGEAVAYAEGRGVGLEDLSLEELHRFSPDIGEDVYGVLDYANAVARRHIPGGTGPDSVQAQMASIAAWLQTN